MRGLMRTLETLLCVVPVTLTAQSQQGASRYPVLPKSLGEADEVALAMSAAPEEISSRADVFVLRGSEFVKVRFGSNGCACMVGRDLHDGSRYPICYDEEGAKTLMPREIMEGSLRAKGMSESDVQHAVQAAYDKGELRLPAKASLAYMMSRQQVLFSSPDEDGVRVGSWSPHLMLLLPGVEPSQIGLGDTSKVDIIQIHRRGAAHAELVVKVPKWSDGTLVQGKKP